LPVLSYLDCSFHTATIVDAIQNGNHYGKLNAMMTTLTIDGAGRLVLPKPVREELQLSAGDSLELETSENEIVLRPVRGAATMRKKQGVWVMSTGKPLSGEVVNDTIRKIREERGRVDINDLRSNDPRDKDLRPSLRRTGKGK
jgi:AbrB family looped-hinge helix DNA binding protein